MDGLDGWRKQKDGEGERMEKMDGDNDRGGEEDDGWMEKEEEWVEKSGG